MQNPASTAAEQLAWQMKSWKSIEIDTTEHFDLNDFAPEGPTLAVRSSHHYVETAAGRRLLEERQVLTNGKETLNIYFKSEAGAAQQQQVDLGNRVVDTVVIQKGFPKETEGGWYNCPEPLRSFYCGLQPLHDALKRAKYLGTNTYLGRTCNEFLIARSVPPDPYKLVFSLDSATSTPLSVAVFDSDLNREQNKPSAVWRAKSLDKIEGMSYVANSEHVIYSSSTPSRPQIVRQIKVGSINLNKDYDKSIFWPKFTPDMQVVDLSTGKIIHPTLSKSVRLENKPNASVAKPINPVASVAEPIRAATSSNWSWLLPSCLVMAGLAILVVVFLRRKFAN